MEIDNRIIEKTNKTFGFEFMTALCMEEFAEVVIAINKVRRNKNEETLEKLNETVADALICIEQLEDLELVDKEKIQKWIDKKQILQNKQLNEINGTCEHCKLLSGDREILEEDRDLELKIGRVNKDFYLEADTVENNVEVEINYCPFCGRKLGE